MGEKKNTYDKVYDWFDSRFGFAKTWLKPVPDYNQNPLYWLGFLLTVAFIMQVTTGIYMTLYYVPMPDQAYSSTNSIISTIPLGHFVETLHLYTAYAMILLAFMHLTRNYFGSAHKTPRELMWIAGVVMLIIVISMGVTGYLLPWTVISKSATDVAIGILGVLPGQLGTFAKSLISGTGSDPDELRRFFTIHTVVLPWALAAFLALKIYLFEVHGPSYIPAYGKVKKNVRWNWFPKIFLYAVKIIPVFIAILFAITSIFPLVLPPQYNPATASLYTVQPEWYLLSVYQVFKFDIFEGSGLAIAIAIIIVLFAFLILLPFYDRSIRRNPGSRPVFITVGLIALTELIVLTIWGYLTPGQTIPNSQALAVTGSVAALVLLATWVIYRSRRPKTIIAISTKTIPTNTAKPNAMKEFERVLTLGKGTKFTGVFAALLSIASIALASLVSMLTNISQSGPLLSLTVLIATFSISGMIWMMKKSVQAYEKRVPQK
jgi:quinol-cytochrome oxidoreductase complex cytochrome b subunit